MGFRSLRHLYGLLLVDGAYSLADATRRMRHKNNTITLDIYTYLVDGNVTLRKPSDERFSTG
ncbi:hypothetical protein [Nocardia barduliensis]|uniref:hypothetical protein n=1 Tax=Nocardia barduliensis TaxID=2736643 RepID=UPI001571F9DC|nr:hypothetical protein [Nocardia barduliensis]